MQAISRLWPVSLLAVLVALAACSGKPAPPTVQRSLLLITIDTLRADRLGTGLMPTLDRLAAESVTFTGARTTVPLTLPAHATILTGLLPPHHGVRENGTARLDRAHPTLATLLQGAGYRTAAVVGAFVLDRQFGLDAGFDRYDDAIPRTPDVDTRLESERKATQVTDAALAAIDGFADTGRAAGAGRPGASPFFLWVHYYDPHAPYEAPPRHLAAAKGDAYDGEAAYVDAEVGRLLDGIGRRGRLQDLVIAVVGDHGESLGEHGEATHGMLLYDAAIRVPFLVKRPEPAKAAIRPEPVSLADVAPTLLAALEEGPGGTKGKRPLLPTPPAMDGVNLMGGDVALDREVYSETNYPRTAGWSPLRALVSGRWKLLRGPTPQLFDLAGDPRETRNVAGDRASLAGAMLTRLRTLDEGVHRAPAAPSGEAQERLRSLGYVSASPGLELSATAPDPAAHIAAWVEFEDLLALVSAGRSNEAAPRLRLLAARYPAAPVFQTTYARALLDGKRAAAALKIYRDAVARWPSDPTLLHDLAVAAQAAGRPDEARRAEQAALVLDPGSPAAHNGLGLLHAEAGRVADAVAAFERAVAAEASNPTYWTNLGNARRTAGTLPGADEAYRRALQIDAAWPDALNGRAVLLVQSGRAREAIPLLEQALSRSPAFVEARLNLGIACQEAGRPECARTHYREVLAAGPGHEREQEAARQLLGMGAK